jgi:hypothetical protein
VSEQDSHFLAICDLVPLGDATPLHDEVHFELATVWPDIEEQATRENLIEQFVREGYVRVSPTKLPGGSVMYRLTDEGLEHGRQLRGVAVAENA